MNILSNCRSLTVCYCHFNDVVFTLQQIVTHNGDEVTDTTQIAEALNEQFSNLEYCSSVWSPHYSKDKAMLERVQHCFTRLFPEIRAMRYEDRLNVLHIWSLEERRNRADLIELFKNKMIHGFTDAPLPVVLQITTDSCIRGHDKKLTKQHCHTDSRLYFFSARVINRWNSLTQTMVDATSVNAFKRHLDDLRQKKMGFFMDV